MHTFGCGEARPIFPLYLELRVILMPLQGTNSTMQEQSKDTAHLDTATAPILECVHAPAVSKCSVGVIAKP
jgi:hypothetical protein